jgi:hypothetical protein
VIKRLDPNQAAPAWPASYPVADDYGAANLGQLKNLAAQAQTELEARCAGSSGADLQALITRLNGAADPTAPLGSLRDDFAGANLGQIKAVSKLFYDRLRVFGLVSTYPWGGNPALVPDDFAPATLGQLKKVFSFPLNGVLDSDNDGLVDAWEQLHFSNLGQVGSTYYSGTNPGINNAQAFRIGLKPNQTAAADTSGTQIGFQVFTRLE